MRERASYLGVAVLVALALLVWTIGLTTTLPPTENQAGMRDFRAVVPEPIPPLNVPVYGTE